MATIDAIRSSTVREALHALRYDKILADSPLLQTRFIDEALRDEGHGDSLEMRGWCLRQLLDQTVEAALAARRTAPGASVPGAAQPAVGSEIDQLRADFASPDHVRQAWGALHFRYLGADRTPLNEVHALLGITDKTFQRRLKRGCSLLAEALRKREVLAASADAMLGAPGRQAAPAITPSTPAATIDDYRLSRAAEWLQPRHELDARFVALSLLVDRGEDSPIERWADTGARYTDLQAALSAGGAPATVILGAPGAGKTTLLRRYELDRAIAGLQGRDEGITFLIHLGQWRSPPGQPHPPAPEAWLAAQWARRNPRMPALAEILAERPVTFLLDGLNEIPHDDPADFRARLMAWKHWTHDATDRGGHRVLFTCRTLDYSAPLSTTERPVPQVRIEPLDDDTVHELLVRYAPALGDGLWRRLVGTSQLDLLRSPYFLRLYLVQALGALSASAPNTLPSLAHRASDPPRGPAALFTGFVRQALRREIEQENPRFQPGPLLTEHELARVAGGWRFKDPYELPASRLFAQLSQLAHRMQAARGAPDGGQARADMSSAMAMLGGPDARDVLRAGEDLGLLDEDRAADELLFRHQLLQEYLAARHAARQPELDRLRRPWRVGDVTPDLERVLATIGPAEPLPPLSASGWENTATMAAAMAQDPTGFVEAVAEQDLVLAAKTAMEPELAGRIDAQLVDRLRSDLAARSRDPEADLRERLACGLALGHMGDPRLTRSADGPNPCLAPPMIHVPAGTYRVGDDEPYDYQSTAIDHHQPAHAVALAAYAMGQFPVTNAEWDLFMAAGGYADPAWWVGPEATAWQRGVGTAEGSRANARFWRAHFLEHPGYLDRVRAEGRIDQQRYDTWRDLLSLDDGAFAARLIREHPDGPIRHPRFWHQAALNQRAQPVVGICWYEARAYCAWLAAMTGRPFRLPSEVEWEVGARGAAATRYAYGNAYRSLDGGNTLPTHIRRTSPIGVFPEGDSAFGLADMAGNVATWTASLWGDGDDRPSYGYPYDPNDGREDPLAPAEVRRILRGGSWNGYEVFVRAAFRFNDHPANANYNLGLRLACDP